MKNGSSKPYRNTQATLEQIKMRLERQGEVADAIAEMLASSEE